MEDSPSSVAGLRASGASVGEQELVELITRHRQEEGTLLERYERFGQAGASPATRYLVNLILEDERRHHRVLAEIADAIAWGGLSNVAPPVPRLAESGDAGLVEQSKRLLRAEKRDRAELKKLRRRLRVYTGTIWPLLIDLMLLDTQKHIRVHRFLIRHNST